MSTEIVRRDILKAGAVTIAATGVASLVGGSPAAAATRTVFRTTEQTTPGDVVVLYGDGLADLTSVQVAVITGTAGSPPSTPPTVTLTSPTTVSTVQPSANSAKFVLPSTFAIGVYGVDFGGSGIELLNRPAPRWIQSAKLERGIDTNELSAGMTIQILGRDLTLRGLDPAQARSQVKAALVSSGGAVTNLTITTAEPYSVTATVPTGLAAGTYSLRMHNGGGGPAGWSEALPVTVKATTTWPSDQFNVKNSPYNAKGDNQTDDTAAIQRALDAAEANGGGFVFFPAGRYRVTGWFRIPEKVVIHGAGRDATWIQWTLSLPATTADLAPAAFYSTGSFVIEDISIVSARAYTVIYDLSYAVGVGAAAPLPELESYKKPFGTERDIFIRRARIFNYMYEGREQTNDPRVPSASTGDYRDNVLFANGVSNVEVSKCDLNGSYKILNCENVRIVDNVERDGMFPLGWLHVGGNHMVIEGNEIRGIVPGLGFCQHTYIAHNFTDNILQGERESMVFDVNSTVSPRKWRFEGKTTWQGFVASASGLNVTMSGASFAADSKTGLDILILSGKGAGQSRTITATASAGVTIAQAWDVPPDTTSLVLLYQQNRDIVMYANECQNASCFGQIYGHVYDSVLAKNVVRQDGGAWGLSGHFVQWLDNDLQIGCTFHASIGPRGSTTERTPEGNATFSAVGFVIRGNFTPTNTAEITHTYPYARGAIVRKNRLTYGHRIIMMYGYGGGRQTLGYTALEDIVIERNTIEDTAIGVELDANVNRAVTSQNTYLRVPTPTKFGDPAKVTPL